MIGARCKRPIDACPSSPGFVSIQLPCGEDENR